MKNLTYFIATLYSTFMKMAIACDILHYALLTKYRGKIFHKFSAAESSEEMKHLLLLLVGQLLYIPITKCSSFLPSKHNDF